MRGVRRGAVAATILLLFSVGVGTAQPPRARNAPAPGEHAPQTLVLSAEGRIQLDVVVTDASGNPVVGLQPRDFSLLDEGKPRKIVSFTAFDGVKAKPDPTVEVILMIDALNNGFVEMGYIRQGVEKYLRQNGGHLTQPTSILRLTASGMETVSKASLDGNALADLVHGLGASTRPTGIYTFPPSMNSLLRLAQEEASRPGRKMLIWLGTGWSTPPIVRETFTSLDARDRRANYNMMVLISKALLDAHIVLYGGYTASEFYLRDYLKGVKKASDVDPRAFSLDVVAYKSGGRGDLSFINRDSDVTSSINHFVAEANTYYALSFDAPQARTADEFHGLSLTVDRAGLKARTVSGYYDQPEFYRPETVPELTESLRQPANEELIETVPVTVAQLIEIVAQEKTKRDTEVAKALERLQLTERLSSAKMAELSTELRGAKAKAALMAVGDSSAFIEPPKAELPDKAAPDLSGQRQIMVLVLDYLKKINPKLPNFYAKRFTTSFEEIWTPTTGASAHAPGALHPAGEFKATVYYREGKEVVNEHGKQNHRLITQGTFGPILNTVIVDAAHSSMQWDRWEDAVNGPMAVFRFHVPQTESHYKIASAAAMPVGGGKGEMTPTAYHGEIGIDPGSGAILRLTLEADPDLGSSLQRADIMVEYGPVAIGGNVYTCPVRSVSMSTGRSDQDFTAQGPAVMREVTRLDDVVFSDYHVFRSEMRIVPFVSENDLPRSSQPQ